ncbi:conserved uncharacterized protein [Desulfobacula toluolica Tol2]|uniref:Conserved uncharacterized protein n=2 Tax=Desulfobacula TaxID=28222 RepID=K0NAW6_DESTT|nr:DUF2760 domain-containing protein [Desulfobacula phenolica]CCK81344.1 conserved uncharacterized protein [Desulfobacula toluolica Tol2]SDU25846.1 protein of unknown function [Desulfobacula phenolica]
MEVSKVYSKRLFGVITLLALLISAGINIGLYFGMRWLTLKFSQNTENEIITKTISEIVNNVEFIFHNFYLWVIPTVIGFFLLLGCVLWLILRNSVSKAFNGFYITKDEIPSKGKSKKDFVDQKTAVERKQRLFLHSLSVLQKDGRLLDFFDEDLSLYDDEQIGAAVRSIQEDCKKTIKKYIDPKPVIDNEEGSKVSIEPGFDIDSIKLVGNVAGDPPFEGVLKHRGWKAGKKEIPKLSDIQDSTIIIPAEVEIK